MARNNTASGKSIHQLAFGHYLRTGQRLTNDEWLDRWERKFNPYHDEIGRFTSPPGVTVSWGAHGQRSGADPGDASLRHTRSPASELPGGAGADAHRSAAIKPASPADGLRSDFVRNAVFEAANADSYFELNKREAGLSRLREAAGSKPARDVKDDLDKLQARLTANRLVLDQRSKIADQQVVEILRAGLPPADTLVGAAKILSGDGELRDALAVAGSVPILGVAGKFGRIAKAGQVASEAAEGVTREVVQRGGAYWQVRGMAGYHAHHMPGVAVSPLSRGRGPAIAMLKRDHLAVVTSVGGADAKLFRAAQKAHIARGDFAAAMQMDIDEVRRLHGARYGEAIEQALKYARKKGFVK